MLVKLLNLKGLLFLASTFLIFSCSQNESTESAAIFADDTIDIVNRDAKAGVHGCFEFVFPITITFEDGTTASPDSYELLKESIMQWKDQNPDATQRPVLTIPLEIMDDEGNLISVDSRLELRAVVKKCKKEFFQSHPNIKKLRCFRLIFPIGIEFPNGEIISAENRPAAKMAIREWKIDNPNATERPVLVFPIDVLLRDGSTQTINSREELKALKEDCGK